MDWEFQVDVFLYEIGMILTDAGEEHRKCPEVWSDVKEILLQTIYARPN